MLSKADYSRYHTHRQHVLNHEDGLDTTLTMTLYFYNRKCVFLC